MIVIGCDHGGYELKFNLTKKLQEKGYTIVNYGSNTSDRVDYPEYAFKVGNALKEEIELGILICGTGIGMSIAANKVEGVRCALVHNTKEAKLTKEHNNANCIALSSTLSMFRIKDILDVFINTKFSNEERHQRRVDMINNYK